MQGLTRQNKGRTDTAEHGKTLTQDDHAKASIPDATSGGVTSGRRRQEYAAAGRYDVDCHSQAPEIAHDREVGVTE